MLVVCPAKHIHCAGNQFAIRTIADLRPLFCLLNEKLIQDVVFHHPTGLRLRNKCLGTVVVW